MNWIVFQQSFDLQKLAFKTRSREAGGYDNGGYIGFRSSHYGGSGQGGWQLRVSMAAIMTT